MEDLPQQCCLPRTESENSSWYLAHAREILVDIQKPMLSIGHSKGFFFMYGVLAIFQRSVTQQVLNTPWFEITHLVLRGGALFT